jgi:hypothetical protein
MIRELLWGTYLDIDEGLRDGADLASLLQFLADLRETWYDDSGFYYNIAKCFHKSPKHGRDPVEQRERALQLRDEIEAILFPG